MLFFCKYVPYENTLSYGNNSNIHLTFQNFAEGGRIGSAEFTLKSAWIVDFKFCVFHDCFPWICNGRFSILHQTNVVNVVCLSRYFLKTIVTFSSLFTQDFKTVFEFLFIMYVVQFKYAQHNCFPKRYTSILENVRQILNMQNSSTLYLVFFLIKQKLFLYFYVACINPI